MTTPNSAIVVITKEDREDGIGELLMDAGEHEIQDLVMRAYRLGRLHERRRNDHP